MSQYAEGQILHVEYANVARELRLVSRQLVWGVPYWHCDMEGVPCVISEARIEELRMYGKRSPSEMDEESRAIQVWRRDRSES